MRQRERWQALRRKIWTLQTLFLDKKYNLSGRQTSEQTKSMTLACSKTSWWTSNNNTCRASNCNILIQITCPWCQLITLRRMKMRVTRLKGSSTLISNHHSKCASSQATYTLQSKPRMPQRTTSTASLRSERTESSSSLTSLSRKCHSRICKGHYQIWIKRLLWKL